MKLLLIDPSVAGISGDMFIGALLDLGAPLEPLEEAVRLIGAETGREVGFEIEDVERKSIRCRRVVLKVREDFEGLSYDDIRGYMEKILEECRMGREAKDFAIRTLETLIEGEAQVHGGNAHLHELGSVDTLFDILGAASLLDALGVFRDCRVVSTPVNVGSGVVKTSHGELSVPLPLVAEILRAKAVPFLKRHSGELATPTGLALLACLVEEFSEELPAARLLGVGRGAGERELEGAPNMLQLYLCEAPSLEREQIALLETSVDDVPGEILGSAVGELFRAGALDVQIIPTVAKKNRPGYVVQVISPLGQEEALAQLMMRELGTLGVRFSRISMRFRLRRETRKIRVRISDYEGEVRVKLGIDARGEVVTLKPEYEDAKRIAGLTSLPLREVLARIAEEARRRFL
ncbi:nickel pincer cofactor biosynthesis protein LarC [Candidatus Pyrohabitans sp.]